MRAHRHINCILLLGPPRPFRTTARAGRRVRKMLLNALTYDVVFVTRGLDCLKNGLPANPAMQV